MIRTVIAYDDNDMRFGQYFEDSHTDISASFALNVNITNTSVRGLDCTEANINMVLAAIDGRFIFIALSHGNEEELHSHEVYVSDANSSRFANSIFYSTACLTGKVLGPLLVAQSCSTFIGYTKPVTIIDDYSQVHYSCENYGIKSFLNNDESIEVSFYKMKTYYNQEIQRLFELGTTDDVLAAATLVENQISLVLLGDRNVTRADFN